MQNGIAMKADGDCLEKPQPTQLDSADASSRLAPHLNWLLILSALALMPLEEAGYNSAMAVLGVLGLITLIQKPQTLRDPRCVLMLSLLACIWVPMVISLIGAVEPERAMRTTAAFLRFPLAGFFILIALQHPTTRRWLPIGVFVVAAIWSIDGLLQWRLGRNIFGFPYDGVNLRGMFHPKRVIGILLATIMPVLLDVALRLTRRHPAAGAAAWIIVATIPVIVLLGGSRTSWMMLAVGMFGWGLYRFVRSNWRWKHVAALTAIVALAAVTPLLAKLPGLETRMEQTMQLLRGDYENIDFATSGRLPIWEISIAMWRDHPLTGVGPRGFRFLYPDYGDEDTPWIAPDGETGGYHPHQTTLEVIVETGIVGLAGFILFWVLLIRALKRHGTEDAWPWAIAAAVAFFPLNVHMALYSTYWSHVSWWLMMIAIGMLAIKPPKTSDG